MESSTRQSVRAAVVASVVVLGLAAGPGTALAQSEEGVAGTITVEAGETVDGVSAVAGTVIVRGTVTGDVTTLAGNVYVYGDVGGDVSAAAGNVEIEGTVEGDVSGAAGNVVIAEGGTIVGSLEAGAGNVRIDGTVEGDATVGAETIALGEDAAIGGDLRYAGDLEGDTGVVAGEVSRDRAIGPQLGPNVIPIASWLVAAYALALNLLLGAALLALFPRFSASVADRVASDPVRTGLAGLLVLVGVPVLLVAVAITVVGIPFTIVGAFGFALAVWIALVYGRFAAAAWALSLADVDGRWIALVVGLVAGTVLSQVPLLGGLIDLALVLLGLGALSWGVYAHLRRRPESPEAGSPGGPTAE